MGYLHKIIEWIDRLEDGEHFRRSTARSLRISAVLTVIISVFLGLTAFALSIASIFLIPLGFIALVIIIIWGILLAMLLRNRADKILGLREGSHLTFGPMSGILTRLAGEIAFFNCCLIGILLLPLAILFIPLGFGLLSLSYMAAERRSILEDIATNIKKMEGTLSSTETPSMPQEETPSEEEG